MSEHKKKKKKKPFKKYLIVNNAINTDFKNMFVRLYDVLSLHKFSSVYILFHCLNCLVSQLFG